MLDGVGGSSCFSFGSNMEMLSASPDLTVRIQAGLEASALRTVHWSNAGETLNKDESERMWFQFRNSGKDLQTVMDTSGMIFCVKHNFDQVSQKKRKRLVWNVLDDYQVRLSEERRGWSRCCLTR